MNVELVVLVGTIDKLLLPQGNSPTEETRDSPKLLLCRIQRAGDAV